MKKSKACVMNQHKKYIISSNKEETAEKPRINVPFRDYR